MRLLLAILTFVTLAAHAEEAKVVASEAPAAVTEAKANDVALTDVKAVVETKKESEIPLNLEAPKKSSEEGHPLFKVLLAISMMGVVGAGAFFFIRKYSKNNFAINRHNQIKVLTQHHLGPKKSLAIIRVAGESILIGVTDQNINMIKSLALLDDEVPEATPEHFAGLIQQDQNESNNEAYRTEAEDEEFSIRGIKDVVSKRLKGMRSLQ